MGVAELVEVLGVPAPGVDQRRQPERRNQHELAGLKVDLAAADVGLDVARRGVLRPTPVAHRGRVDLQLARRRQPTERRVAVLVHDAHGAGLADQRHLGVERDRLAQHALIVGDGALGLRLGQRTLVDPVDLRVDLDHAELPHVLQRCQTERCGLLRQTWHVVLEDVAVVLVDRDLLTGPVRRLEVLADAELAIRVDPPGQLEPELVLLPHLPRVDVTGVGELAAQLLHRHSAYGLAETQPLPGVSLVGVRVVALRRVAHRQHVVGELGCLRPGRCQRHMAADLGLVGERLHPAEAVRVGPDGVVDTREVDVKPTPDRP